MTHMLQFQAVIFWVSLSAHAAAPVAWQEDFDSPQSLERAGIYYEDRGSGLKGEAVIISQLDNGIYTHGLKYDPARRQDRFNLMYGDVCWGAPKPIDRHRLPDDPKDWGPFDLRQYPLVEIRWSGASMEVAYCVETLAGVRRSGYVWLEQAVVATEQNQQGRTWHVTQFRFAPDSSVPGPNTAVKLLGINPCWYSPDREGVEPTQIEYIRVRGFTGEEAAGEANVIAMLRDFPVTRWRGFDDFFPFGVYGIGYGRGSFESWAGDYEGPYMHFARHYFNFVAQGDAVELRRNGGRAVEEGDGLAGVEPYLQEKRALIEAARNSGLRLAADVRGMMQGRDPHAGYQQLLPMARRLCEAFADDEIIVAWTLADEPSAAGLLPIVCKARALTESDPLARPRLVVFNGVSSASYYTPYLDLMYWDNYPVLEGRRNPWQIRQRTREYRTLAPQLPMWAVLQSFETRPPTPPGGYTRPSDAEMRMMAYMALAEGAKGLIWYHGWTGSGRDEGVIQRAGQNRGGMMDTLSDLAQRLIPIGRQLLATDPLDDADLMVAQQDEGERRIVVSTLRHRVRPIHFLVAVNEDLDRERTAEVRLGPSILGPGQAVYDLYALDHEAISDGTSFTIPALAGGDGRIFLVGDAEQFASIRRQIRLDTAREQARTLRGDLTIARRWGLDVAGVDEAMAACERTDDPVEAAAQANSARQRLEAAIASHSLLHAVRRALADMRIELHELSRIAEVRDMKPRWWTGNDHPMLVPNPNFKDQAAQYFNVGRAYRDAHERYLKGDKTGLWERVNKARMDCLALRESLLSLLHEKLGGP